MSNSRRAAGLALMEVLVALAVLAIGLGATLKLQVFLRASTDLSRQRAEALRLAQDGVETLRAMDAAVRLAAGPARNDVEPNGANTRFQVSRDVSPAGDLAVHGLRATVSWPDREGRTHSVRLDTLLPATDTAWSGALALNRSVAASPGSGGATKRHSRIPVQAKSLGDGRSAFKPRSQALLTWVFDDASGLVVARCSETAGLRSDQLDAGSLRDCRALAGLLVQGHVRFAGLLPPDALVDPENPLGPALPLDLRMELAGAPAGQGFECADDSPESTGAAPSYRSVAYHCVVEAVALPPRWSGRLDVVPVDWILAASGAGAWRVCRYSADHDHDGRIGNAEHPAVYQDVGEPLGDQNFLVVAASLACPSDRAVAVVPGTGSNWLDDSTVAHQP